jgi:tagatose 1,6-diphosphate aldolase
VNDAAISTFQFTEPGLLADAELSLRLIRTVPRNDLANSVATYHFEMLVDGEVAGGIRFRAENAFDVESIAGNIGYNVSPGFRGRRLAERACRLLFPLARTHGFTSLWITCDPANRASRITCERLGAVLVDIVAIPQSSDMYQDGERLKCRYLLSL